jgi:hypothetical protein
LSLDLLLKYKYGSILEGAKEKKTKVMGILKKRIP